jgi:hypothetical protein
MIRNLINALARFFWPKTKFDKPLERKFKLLEFSDRASATSAAKQRGVAALISSGNARKWLLFACPCGCNQQIALNLMQNHRPHWEVDIVTPIKFTVYPSIDSTTCGAHFWLRDGMVIWCE